MSGIEHAHKGCIAPAARANARETGGSVRVDIKDIGLLKAVQEESLIELARAVYHEERRLASPELGLGWMDERWFLGEARLLSEVLPRGER